ncbi:DUF4334 domain-containing protein [Streptomyces sp. GC420]|uniref:DUF4334 domain-containing protein n=1 Tax=Streptomyces sp. GC420 TaxID=2697568 RepID=UPI001414E666|nr:DUF4334 domain-containing protein [Streptomyces sp. GC420]NBM18227.1 DUF4334 domain-containing protein [Streptomyces sp. GC420]
MDAEQARTRIAAVRAAGGKVSTEELDELWAALETVRPEEILGSWKGSEFVSGHRAEGRLARANWYGKTFRSVSDAKPLICRDADGELFSDVRLGKGEASLWMVEFRGESTATMVYDGMPVLDHFKRIDGSTLLGVMNGKDALDDGRHYYFVLERD